MDEVTNANAEFNTVYGRYVVRTLLGKGSFGKVVGVRDRQLGMDIAIKMVNVNNRRPGFHAADIDREISIMEKLHHRNVVKILGVTRQRGRRYIRMELCNSGNVNEFVLQHDISLAQVRNLAFSMLSALRYVHEQNIVHNDFKPDNIMVHRTPSGQYIYKLTDFGISRLLESPYARKIPKNDLAGTPDFNSPEKWRSDYNAKSDIYALGFTVYILLTGRHPCATPPAVMAPMFVKLMRIVMADNFSVTFAKTDQLSEQAKAFVRSLTTNDPEARPTATQAQSDPWLNDADTVSDVASYVRESLTKYAGLTELQRIVRRSVSGALDASDIQAMKSVFDQVTRQRLIRVHDLPLTLEKMRELIDYLHLDPALIDEIDTDANGTVDVDEFVVAVLAPWLWKTEFRADKLYAQLRANKDSIDDAAVLEKLADGNGSELFDAMDTNHDHRISKSEFRSWVLQRES